MNSVWHRVRVDNTLSNEFDVRTWLQQGDTLPLIILNIALEKCILSVQRNNQDR